MLGRKKKVTHPAEGQIKKLLSDLGRMESVGARAAIPKTLEELDEGESVEAAIPCMNGKYAGLAIGTDRRLLIVTGNRSIFNVEEFAYQDIKSVEAGQGILLGEIIIHGAHNRAVLKHIQKKLLPDFHKWLRQRAGEKRSTPGEVADSAATSAADEILKLAALRDQGILTEDEFTAKKTQLLGLD